MTDQEYLDVFGQWVAGLPKDAEALKAVYEGENVDREIKLMAVGALAYLLRKIDIVPDYLGGLGTVDDAMVLRLMAKKALPKGIEGVDASVIEHLQKMAQDVAVIEEFLGEDFSALEKYVDSLTSQPVRNRTPEKVLDDAEAAEQFAYELSDELRAYQVRSIDGGERALRELRSFIRAKVNK